MLIVIASHRWARFNGGEYCKIVLHRNVVNVSINNTLTIVYIYIYMLVSFIRHFERSYFFLYN